MFKFPSVCTAQMNHKEMCMRLYTILHSNTVFPRCRKCMEFSCQPYCVEDSNSKVVVDIGNKFTWVITPLFYIHRHYTLFGIPKMPANNGGDWYVALLSTVSIYNKFWDWSCLYNSSYCSNYHNLYTRWTFCRFWGYGIKSRPLIALLLVIMKNMCMNL